MCVYNILNNVFKIKYWKSVDNIIHMILWWHCNRLWWLIIVLNINIGKNWIVMSIRVVNMCQCNHTYCKHVHIRLLKLVVSLIFMWIIISLTRCQISKHGGPRMQQKCSLRSPQMMPCLEVPWRNCILHAYISCGSMEDASRVNIQQVDHA
jgi:hypothetical protein